MNAEAKRIAIRWRRILFGFHLLVWLIARLAVGSIGEMPPSAIYSGLEVWGLIVFAHGVALAFLDGRDHADLPFERLHALIEPRERRWSLLAVDMLLWIMFTMAVANRVIPEATLFRYVQLLALLWLAHTAFGLFHILLMIYAEVRDFTAGKRKNDEKLKPGEMLKFDDGELIDFTITHETRHSPIERR